MIDIDDIGMNLEQRILDDIISSGGAVNQINEMTAEKNWCNDESATANNGIKTIVAENTIKTTSTNDSCYAMKNETSIMEDDAACDLSEEIFEEMTTTGDDSDCGMNYEAANETVDAETIMQIVEETTTADESANETVATAESATEETTTADELSTPNEAFTTSRRGMNEEIVSAVMEHIEDDKFDSDGGENVPFKTIGDHLSAVLYTFFPLFSYNY